LNTLAQKLDCDKQHKTSQAKEKGEKTTESAKERENETTEPANERGEEIPETSETKDEGERSNTEERGTNEERNLMRHRERHAANYSQKSHRIKTQGEEDNSDRTRGEANQRTQPLADVGVGRPQLALVRRRQNLQERNTAWTE
jgi:hypothetical protein